MKKRIFSILCAFVLVCSLFVGCSSRDQGEVLTQPSSVQESTQDAAAQQSVEPSQDAQQSAEASQDAAAQQSTENADTETVVLEDGVYTADFDTDSSMFRVNDAKDGKGVLTVENGQMTIHVSLVSKKILNLYAGLAEEAQKEGAAVLQPTTDSVTYSDGITEEVYGFDIPVPALDEEFDVALVGEKGTWYDHKVSVSNPQKAD